MLERIIVLFTEIFIFVLVNKIVSDKRAEMESVKRKIFTGVLAGSAAVFCMIAYERAVQMFIVFAFLTVLIMVAFEDFDTRRIADKSIKAILILSLAAVVFMPESSFAERLVGAGCVSVPMLVIALIIPGAFGGGDIKLMAASGFFLGAGTILKAVFPALLTAAFYAVWLLVVKRADRKEEFAFGPFLCIGMAAALIFTV